MIVNKIQMTRKENQKEEISLAIIKNGFIPYTIGTVLWSPDYLNR